jgi:hypothetical protein
MRDDLEGVIEVAEDFPPESVSLPEIRGAIFMVALEKAYLRPVDSCPDAHTTEHGDLCVGEWSVPLRDTNLPLGCRIVGTMYDFFRDRLFIKVWHESLPRKPEGSDYHRYMLLKEDGEMGHAYA